MVAFVTTQAEDELHSTPVQVLPCWQPSTVPPVIAGVQAAPVDCTPNRLPLLPVPPVTLSFVKPGEPEHVSRRTPYATPAADCTKPPVMFDPVTERPPTAPEAQSPAASVVAEPPFMLPPL